MDLREKKNTEELIKYFRKNKKELKDLIDYLDRFSGGWRREKLKYFLDLLKLEREMLEEKKRELRAG